MKSQPEMVGVTSSPRLWPCDSNIVDPRWNQKEASLKSKTASQIVLAFMVFVFCSCGTEKECTNNLDCPANQFCNVKTNNCVLLPCQPKSCQDLGTSCGLTQDGCGNALDCGGCQNGYTCNQGQCIQGCVPKNCIELGIECGLTQDGCGDALDCSGCQQGYSCSQGECVFGCVPKSCVELGTECGITQDGCGDALDCGGCPDEYSCSQGLCVQDCVPKSCVEMNIECGYTDNGCGDTLDCGGCAEGYSCSQGQCVQDCVPSSCLEMSIECGYTDNGCGDTLDCGGCQEGYSCYEGLCLQDCVPLSCEELGKHCGNWPTGCDTTIDCGACLPDQICEEGTCVREPDEPPVLVLRSQAGSSFTLEWTYTWDGLVSSQDFYQLQESTQGEDGPFATILETTRGDHSTPYSVDITRAAGTYYFRVRTWDSGFWTDFSNVITVDIVQIPPVLRLVNDLTNSDSGGNTWSIWNQIYKVWIADSEATLNECTDWSCGRLEGASCALPGETLLPGGDSKDFDVSMYADGEYWVFIQVGYWDYFCTETSCCWTEHATNVLDCAGNCCILKWAYFSIYDHFADTFTVNASQFLPHTSWYQTGFCQ